MTCGVASDTNGNLLVTLQQIKTLCILYSMLRSCYYHNRFHNWHNAWYTCTFAITEAVTHIQYYMYLLNVHNYLFAWFANIKSTNTLAQLHLWMTRVLKTSKRKSYTNNAQLTNRKELRARIKAEPSFCSDTEIQCTLVVGADLWRCCKQTARKHLEPRF